MELKKIDRYLGKTWYVVHRPHNDVLAVSELRFDEQVYREQAIADAEYTYGGDFGTVYKVSADEICLDDLNVDFGEEDNSYDA